MRFVSGFSLREQDIRDLFTSSFTASENADEGRLIGELTQDLMETTPSTDLVVWSAYEAQTLLGCIFLSRVTFAQDPRSVFILSPVAVKTEHQKQGVGQRLIATGLDDLRQKGADYVVTYGDPRYYAKTGFAQITEDFAQAPQRLNYPEGWLGQPLSDNGKQPLLGPSRCVSALNKPEIW